MEMLQMLNEVERQHYTVNLTAKNFLPLNLSSHFP